MQKIGNYFPHFRISGLGPVFDRLIRIRVFSRSNVFGSIPPPPHCLIQPSVGPLRMFTYTGGPLPPPFSVIVVGLGYTVQVWRTGSDRPPPQTALYFHYQFSQHRERRPLLRSWLVYM